MTKPCDYPPAEPLGKQLKALRSKVAFYTGVLLCLATPVAVVLGVGYVMDAGEKHCYRTGGWTATYIDSDGHSYGYCTKDKNKR